jgi:dihydroflavonol-4-reductase
MQAHYFITGCTGLVGSHLLVNLFLQQVHVKALIRKTSSFDQIKLICDFYTVSFEELYDAVEWVYGDTLDYLGLIQHLYGIDTIFHCAALVSFNSNDKENLMLTNVRGTANVVDAALEAKVASICFISSIAALGKTNDGRFIDEMTPRDVNRPVSFYSESKYYSELEVWRGAAEGLNVIILNPGVILGPGLPGKGSLLLFKIGSKGLPFYTRSVTGYVDVRDICKVAIELTKRKIYGHRFVLVSENVSNQRLFGLISAAFHKKPPFIHLKKSVLIAAVLVLKIASLFTKKAPVLTYSTIRTVSDPEYYESAKIIQLLDFQFTPIEETINDTAHFLKTLTDTKKPR